MYRVIKREYNYRAFTSEEFIVQREDWDYLDTAIRLGIRSTFPFIYIKDNKKVWTDIRRYGKLGDATKHVDRLLNAITITFTDTVVYP